MTGVIIISLLISFSFAAIFIRLDNDKKKGRPTSSDSMNDITNPSHSWHPLNMWHDD